MIYPGPKHVAILETQILLSKYSSVMTDTHFVCCFVTTKGNVTHKNHKDMN